MGDASSTKVTSPVGATITYPRRNIKAKHEKGAYAMVIQDTASVITHAELTQEEASEAYTSALEAWGLSESSEKDRSELTYALAQALVISTSADDENMATRFKFRNRYYNLVPLRDAILTVTNGKQTNPLRVWVRSFNYAQIPCMITDMLLNPNNVALRQEIAARVGCSQENAYLAHDTFTYTYKFAERVYSNEELHLHMELKARRLAIATANAQATGALTTANDSTTRIKNDVQSNTRPSQRADPVVRAAFQPLAGGK